MFILFNSNDLLLYECSNGNVATVDDWEYYRGIGITIGDCAAGCWDYELWKMCIRSYGCNEKL